MDVIILGDEKAVADHVMTLVSHYKNKVPLNTNMKKVEVKFDTKESDVWIGKPTPHAHAAPMAGWWKKLKPSRQRCQRVRL